MKRIDKVIIDANNREKIKSIVLDSRRYCPHHFGLSDNYTQKKSCLSFTCCTQCWNQEIPEYKILYSSPHRYGVYLGDQLIQGGFADVEAAQAYIDSKEGKE